MCLATIFAQMLRSVSGDRTGFELDAETETFPDPSFFRSSCDDASDLDPFAPDRPDLPDNLIRFEDLAGETTGSRFI